MLALVNMQKRKQYIFQTRDQIRIKHQIVINK